MCTSELRPSLLEKVVWGIVRSLYDLYWRQNINRNCDILTSPFLELLDANLELQEKVRILN